MYIQCTIHFVILQKAEATLMCWDALMEEHRVQKYQTLQERVGIQRDLIIKNDQLSNDLRRRDEEERLGVRFRLARKIKLILMYSVHT